MENAGIWIAGERIKEVGHFPEIQAHVPQNTKVIELPRATVVPGLIDMTATEGDPPSDITAFSK